MTKYLFGLFAVVFAVAAQAQVASFGAAGFAASQSASAAIAVIKVGPGDGTATANVVANNVGDTSATVTPTALGGPINAIGTSSNTSTVTPTIAATGTGEAYAGGAGAGNSASFVAGVRYFAPTLALLPVLPPLMPTIPVIVAPLPAL
jgi:ABC-type proline/glycine betaine transport system substrate-binding protein